MNKGGGVGLSGGGPTAAAAAAAAQKQKTLLQRVDTDITSIVDNFSHLVNVSRVNDPPVRNSQEAFMMEMRAARMLERLIHEDASGTVTLTYESVRAKPSLLSKKKKTVGSKKLPSHDKFFSFALPLGDFRMSTKMQYWMIRILLTTPLQVQSADSLLKLVSELKQTAIFSGLASLNEHVEQRTMEFNQQAEKTERTLARIGEEAAGSLKELETHYYSSVQKIDPSDSSKEQ